MFQLWAAVACLLLVGCDFLKARTAGTFAIRFGWEGGVAPGDLPSQSFVVARVRNEQGQDVVLAGPEAYGSGLELALKNVPNGQNLQILAELRDKPGAAAQVLYYGASKSFMLKAGKHVDVEVRFSLKRVPRLALPEEGEAGPLNVLTHGGSGVTNTTDIQLLLATDTGAQVILSNEPGFPPSAATSDPIALTEPTTEHRVPAGFTGFVVRWNLRNGAIADCADNVGCPRRVYARFVDAEGQLSAVASASVVLDRLGPGVNSAVVSYLAPSGTALPEVAAAKAGAVVSINFIADELLDLDLMPTLVAAREGHFLTFAVDAETLTNRSVTFRATVPEGLADGRYALTLFWRDLAWNPGSVASARLPTIEVKTSQPALTVDQSKVVFVRSPWGNTVPETTGAFTIPAGPYFALAPADPLGPEVVIPGDAFATDGDRPHRVRFWADSEKGSLLGYATPNADGSWPRLRLPQLDVSAVWATALDVAGNESVPVRIENGEWVATPTYLPGASNPNVLETTTQAVPTLRTDAATTKSSGSLVVSATQDSLLAAAEGAWRQRGGAAPSPPARRFPVMAYDSARGRVVLFGGYADPFFLQDTWEWDGSTWTDRTPGSSSPPSRSGHAMVYDSARGRVVLFGGGIAGSQFQDTWEWDGSAWMERTPSLGPSPPARVSHAMAYDAARGRVVLFGGDSSSGRFQDTWEWDGSTWTAIVPSGLLPVARRYHAMAYDSARARVLLFSGWGGTDLRDTWEWDGRTWTQRTPATSPPTTTYHSLAYDSARGRTVLFGGGRLGARLGIWEWDGSTWIQCTPATAPPGRYGQAMAYDAARRRVVVFGGNGDSLQDFQDTWEWDGTTWNERTPTSTAPDARQSHAMAYDSSRGRVVLFGGYTPASRLQDTWEWDGETWKVRTPAGPSPSGRVDHAMAYDAAHRRVILFGGTHDGVSNLQDTWEWDGSTWTERTPAGSSPPARMGHAMAYDAARGRVVLFGGPRAVQDTWEWDGSAWTERTPPVGPSPPARYRHAMAYDAARGRVVLFGGYSSSHLQDTWEWDGSAWTERTPAGLLPPARDAHSMASDAAGVVLFGGWAGSFAKVKDLWEWNGSAWTERTPLTGLSPSVRAYQAMAYDSARGRTVLFGGEGGNGFRFQDTWEWDRPASLQPAFLFTSSVATAGIEASAVTGVRVRARCGGRYHPYTATDTGAALYGWTSYAPQVPTGGWLPLDLHSAGVAATQPFLPSGTAALLDWTAASTTEARRFVLERDRHMSFQCRPNGVSGNGRAQVAMDYIEVRLRYATRNAP